MVEIIIPQEQNRLGKHTFGDVAKGIKKGCCSDGLGELVENSFLKISLHI